MSEVTENPLAKFDADTLKGIAVSDQQATGRAMFLPNNMAEAMEFAKLMAAGNFVPKHLRGKAGDCLAVVMQSSRWGMDPFAVANKSFFVNDRMAFEAQLVAAVINSASIIEGRLNFEWEGEGENLVCRVSGKIKGDPVPKTREVRMKTITTRNSPLWKQDPEQQIAYYAGRAWARLHAPDLMMGVYTPDEVKEIDGGELKPQRLTRAALQSHGTQEPEQAETVDEETGEISGEAVAEQVVREGSPLDHPAHARAEEIIAEIVNCADVGTLNAKEDEHTMEVFYMPDDIADRVMGAFAARLEELTPAE